MKTVQPETELATAVDAIFRRWPTLVGFCVQQEPSSAELVVSELETGPWPERPHELRSDIAAALLDLIDQEPAARELLRGRTFARRLH